MVTHDDEWELAIVWRDPARGTDDVAVHTVRGLTEAELCRLFGVKGGHVPVWPVPVRSHETGLLEPYVAEPIAMPDGATGELRPIGGEPERRPTRLWLPVVYAIVAGLLGAVLWHAGNGATGWQRSLYRALSGLLVVLAFWFVGFLVLLFVMGVMAVRRNRALEALDEFDATSTGELDEP